MKKNEDARLPGTRFWQKLVLIMKLTTIIYFACLMQVSATVYSQATKFAFTAENKKVIEVLKEIEDNSNFRFFYQNEQVDVNRRVSVIAKNATVEQILDEIFKGEDISYKVMEDYLILLSPEDKAFKTVRNEITASRQQRSVSGKVTDESGQPLPGVTVVVKGTTQGTISNADGEYSITNIPDDATLLFSFVGMKTQEIVVGNQTRINVKMEVDAIGLDEVVAIGYGTQKKSNLTSSISKITNEALSERPIMSVGEALQGQLAGVRSQSSSGGVPGRDLTIRIRGMNTINGDATPLYVIDGIPRDNMSDINPSDIASIQVLKDAAATSIYGARGGNGVILIETKRGKGKPSVTFDAYFGLSQAEKQLEMMSGPEWIAYNMFRRNLNHLRSGGSLSDPMSEREIGNQIPDSWSTTTEFTDWQDAMLQTGQVQNYQFSASASGDIGDIYFSAGYLDQQGVLIYSYFKRKNVRMNSTINASDRLKFGINLTASQSDRDDADADGGSNGNGKESSLHHALMLTPLMGLDQGTRDWGFPEGIVGRTYPNPVEQQKETLDKHINNRIGSILWGELEIIDNLKFKTQYGYNYDGYTYEFFQPGNVTYANGNITKGNSNSSTTGAWTFQNTLAYDKVLGTHTLNLLIGQSSSKQKYYYIGATANGWPYETIQTLNVASTPTRATTSRTTYTTASFFGRLNYEYLDKYLLSASLRYDGSSRFGPNTKWGYFPSISVGWKINEEAFLKDADWLSLLKIRTAFGTSGNDRIGNYAYMALLGINNTSWDDAVASGVAPNRLANEDLQWEETQTLDFGLDISAFNSRVQLNVDYYRNKTTNLLFSVPVPYSTGFSSYTTNIGSVANRGWEVDLTSNNIRGKINWSTNLNLSRNRNKVLDMGDIDQFTQTSWDAQFITRVGGPVSEFYCYETDGVLLPSDFDSEGNALVATLAGQREGNARYIDQNGDEIINSDDYVAQGSNLPDVIYGLTNRFSYKNFDFSILIQGQYGGEVLFLGARQYDNGQTDTNVFKRWLKFYKEDYTSLYGENPIPIDYATKYGIDFSWDGKTNNPIGSNNNNDDRRIYDSSYLRIKNITLGYNIPKSILMNSIIKGLKCYASLDNIITFDNYPGYTPETNSFGDNTTRQGLDYSTYPLSRKLIFGINIIF